MKHVYYLVLSILSLSAFSQERLEVTPPAFIRSIEFTGNSDYSGNPIIQLGENLSLAFDDIIGDEADYYYTIEHFNYDWSPSNLVKSEYLDGIDNVRIFNYSNSYNTLQPYTHYELNIPNNDIKQLKVSGNYIISIFNSSKEIVFSRKFMIYENLSKVAVAIKRSRDLQYINTKQIVNIEINSQDLLIRNPESTVNILILQNQNLKQAIRNIKPQYTIGNSLIYKYDSPTSFWAGNEYLQFDSKDLRSPTLNISRIELDALYHHYLFTNSSRDTQPYTYNPDINGQFVVRTLQGEDSNTEAEYIWTHFSLQNFENLSGGELHIYGAFNNFEVDNSTLMKYSKEKGLYENARLFKQGFYNYKYVLVQKDGSLDEGFISGNFDETENFYQVLVYFRDLGARYDKIIGLGNANSINITN
ncbi:DUF5103 domain-containing protein [Gillisia sp. Hel_I_29]|uniref:type IX secretion system plug protein n=1 Tax=Gillisia sp. Hel_I_29 TaxID=1249975 RepID=UPI0005566969|nr:DUF5103 domain-containing protein [Gillisia sp. Hel_I_29]